MALNLAEEHFIWSQPEEARANVRRILDETEREVDPVSYRARRRAVAGGFRSALNPDLADG